MTTIPSFERDERGLLKNISYVYRPDGDIDWRKMIAPEFLVVHKEYEEELVRLHNKPSKEIDRSLIEDHKLLILLGGIKRLLFIRGYRSLIRKMDYISPERAVCTCTIEFAPNYETSMVPVVYSDVASASLYNTSGDISQQFLEATAANRAFVRATRGFLNINIVGKDEIGPAKAKKGAPTEASNAEVEVAPSGFQPKDTLAKKCHEQGLSFDQIRKAAIKVKAELKTDPETWKAFEDVPALDCYTLLDKLTKKK